VSLADVEAGHGFAQFFAGFKHGFGVFEMRRGFHLMVAKQRQLNSRWGPGSFVSESRDATGRGSGHVRSEVDGNSVELISTNLDVVNR
jgi:hypothetical protein